MAANGSPILVGWVFWLRFYPPLAFVTQDTKLLQTQLIKVF